MAEQTQLDKLKIRIPHDEKRFESTEIYEAKLKSLLEDAESIALRELYPFLDDYEGIELPKGYYNWQLRACEELYGNVMSGVKAYSENGLSISKSNDGPLSSSLLSELVPKAKAPKRSE